MIQKTPPESSATEKTSLESSTLHEIIPERLTMEWTITGETVGVNPLREKAIREESTKEQIVARSPAVEESITENPSRESHEGEDHVTGTIQTSDGMR